MTPEDTFAVVRAFMKAIASVIASIEDMPPSAKTIEFAVQLTDELQSELPDHFNAEQKKLFAQLSTMLKHDIEKARENREILKNPQ